MHSAEAIEFYTRYHRRWFEGVDQFEPNREYRDLFDQLAPEHWALNRSGVWYSAQPVNAELPDQGWKLHVSVSTEDSVSAFASVLPLLLEEQIPFKFLLDSSVTALTNGKLWHRGGSGKFMTIYPCCENRFRRVGERLHEALQSFAGPYILSDRRWPGSRALHYRYGGFRALPVLQINGTRSQMIRTPSGDLQPDLRQPRWNPPDWVTDPLLPVLMSSTTENATAAPARIDTAGSPKSPESNSVVRNGIRLADGRYHVESALSFSNRGGVYKGSDQVTGRTVVIKEARPLVEIGTNRHEAVSVLEKEYRLLRALQCTGSYVRPHAFLRIWEHAFLVEEYIDGDSFGRYSIMNNPLYTGDLSGEALCRYYRRMRGFWLQIFRAMQSAHSRGISLGDLSFTNILISEGRIIICDLETANDIKLDSPVGLQTPGMATEGVSDFGNDYYAFGMLVFGSIMLAHGVCGYYPLARSRFLAELKTDLALPAQLIELIDDLSNKPEQMRSDPEAAMQRLHSLSFDQGKQVPRLTLPRDRRYSALERQCARDRASATLSGISRYLLRTGDTQREDRLFPADLLVFETNPLSVAYGAAGVFHTMHHLQAEIPEAMLQWFLRHPIDHGQYPGGLYIGQAGIAWVLDELGFQDQAVHLLRAAGEQISAARCPDILHGAAGYGMACLRLWQQGAGHDMLNAAIRIGEELESSCLCDGRGARWKAEDGTTLLGYARGGSGIALYLLYLAVASGRASFQVLGRQALEFELSRGVFIDGRLAGFPDRVAPDRIEHSGSEQGPLSCYWQDGSAGIGTTVARYYAVSKEPTLRRWLDDIVQDCARKYTAFPQLFRGVAGLGNFLIDAWQVTGDDDYRIAAWEAAEGAQLCRVDCEEGIGFLGEQARRESADLATGAAGIGLFLRRLLDDNHRHLDNSNFVVDEILAQPLQQASRQGAEHATGRHCGEKGCRKTATRPE